MTDEFMTTALERFRLAEDAERENRDNAMTDLEFDLKAGLIVLLCLLAVLLCGCAP